jgi:RNA polymerase primary sigma factor
MRNFARSVPKEQYRLGRFPTGSQDALDIAASLRAYDSDEVNLSELRESIDAMLAQLLPQERAILINHYGLDEKGQTKTLNELGRELGLSKERVRQIELKALKKLRTIIYPQKADFLA